MEHVCYGFPIKGTKPSQFEPDLEVNTQCEIKAYKNDLRKELEGYSEFSYKWGMGTTIIKC